MNKTNTTQNIQLAIKNKDHLQIKEFIGNPIFFKTHWLTLLNSCIKYDDLTYLEKILMKNIDLNQRNQNQRSPLTIAARQGKTKAIKILLNYGANIHQDKDQALYEAVHLAQKEAVALLIQQGADYKQYYPQLIKCAERHKNRNGILDFLKTNLP